jgi:nitrate/nitrite transporter NarK
MAASQLASVAARIAWGVFADRFATRRVTLGMLGIGMGLTALAGLAPPDPVSDVTGGSSFFTFLGVVFTPSLFHAALSITGSYGTTYALLVGARLLLTARMAADA